ncbi:50S ribosomal protein L13 [Candidatus Mycoplasma haematominutum]|uniref:Large ribosomal subunit protein uL13 n=1 Tax=Candidatus Mycoplasma haematominutum 'Birmingham 1' TaxID=1116213 RepID=G8C3B9_9MOLU|nr:50S ribosomal protein L13 [Candidatus Mycoplasma haematominutum]CCE66817.1 ribosomal protein L13 [Candidatus Mycoplasma haematominutum 'Birmingham 1']
MFKTTLLTKEQAWAQRKWILLDAQGEYLGRLAVKIATLLRGKEKVDFTPSYDCGAFIVVVNSDKLRLSGNKAKNEYWYRHSGYPGGLKCRSGAEMLEKYSDKLLMLAVKRMLPKNRYLSRALLRKLKIYKGGDHPHKAQLPDS